MSLFNKYFFALSALTLGNFYASEIVVRYCQKQPYTQEDIRKTVNDSFKRAETAYNQGNYQEAALFASGALQYADMKKTGHLDATTVHNMHFIIADCHLNHLNSPHHALLSLEVIHDIATDYGTLTASAIADCLRTKAYAIQQTNPHLSQKLQKSASCYTTLTFAQQYENKSVKNIISSLQSAKTREEQTALCNVLKKHTRTGNMRAHVYYTYFNAILSNESQKKDLALQEFTRLTDAQITLRNYILECIINKSQKSFATIFKLEKQADHNCIVAAFVTSDGNYIIPLLEKEIQKNEPSSDMLHYILGQLYYAKDNYKQALLHLQACSAYKTDVLTQNTALEAYVKTIDSWSYENALQVSSTIKLMLTDKKKNIRNQKQKDLSIHALSQYALMCAREFLKNNDHQKAIEVGTLCLNIPETYAIGLNIITLTHNHFAKSNNSILIESNAFNLIKQHWNKTQEEADLTVLSPLIANHLLSPGKSKLTIDNSLLTQALELALNTNEYGSLMRFLLQDMCGAAYYQLSKQASDETKKVQNLYRAVDYNNYDAMLELGPKIFDPIESVGQAVAQSFLLSPQDLALDTINTQMAPVNIRLLHKIESLARNTAASNALRIQALNFLANLHYTIILDDNNIPHILIHDEKTTARYLCDAYELGSTDNLNCVAQFYADGVKDNTSGLWVIQPDLCKAQKILEASLKNSSNISTQFALAEVLFLRGKEYFDRSFQIFNKIALKPHTQYTQEKQKALLYMCAIKLENPNKQNILDAYEYELQQNFQYSLSNAITNSTYQKLHDYTCQLLQKKNSDVYALAAYIMLADIFYGLKKKNLQKNIDEQHVVRCLQFAARHGFLAAKIIIIGEEVAFINKWEKIDHIQEIMKNLSRPSDVLLKNMVQLLKKYHPVEMHEKIEYIAYLQKKNTTQPLSSYLLSLNFRNIPEKASASFSINDTGLALKFHENTILKKYVAEFNTYTKSAVISLQSLHVMLNYIYTLMNSDNPKLIQESAQYANTILNFAQYKNNPSLQYIRSICYYKLAHHPSTPPTLAAAYQKKVEESGLLNDPDFIRLIPTILPIADVATTLLMIRDARK